MAQFVVKRRPTAAGVARSSRLYGRIFGVVLAALLIGACFLIGGNLADSMTFAEKHHLASAFQENNGPQSDDSQGVDCKNDRHISDDAAVNLKGETKWEHYAHVAQSALKSNGLDKAWTNTVLAMIRVESDGDTSVDDEQDIMQAKEGEGGDIVRDGLPGKCRGCTPESSIYGGVSVLSGCIDDFKECLGRNPDPTNLSDIALLAQGYNYGHRGWFMYLRDNGISEWSLDASEGYQSSIGGLGTADHGYKCQQAYQEFASK